MQWLILVIGSWKIGSWILLASFISGCSVLFKTPELIGVGHMEVLNANDSTATFQCTAIVHYPGKLNIELKELQSKVQLANQSLGMTELLQRSRLNPGDTSQFYLQGLLQMTSLEPLYKAISTADSVKLIASNRMKLARPSILSLTPIRNEVSFYVHPRALFKEHLAGYLKAGGFKIEKLRFDKVSRDQILSLWLDTKVLNPFPVDFEIEGLNFGLQSADRLIPITSELAQKQVMTTNGNHQLKFRVNIDGKTLPRAVIRTLLLKNKEVRLVGTLKIKVLQQTIDLEIAERVPLTNLSIDELWYLF